MILFKHVNRLASGLFASEQMFILILKWFKMQDLHVPIDMC